MKELRLIFGLLFLMVMSKTGEAKSFSFFNHSLQIDSIEQKVQGLLQRMTLKEKVGQLNQYSRFNYTGPSEDQVDNRFAKRSEQLRNGLVGAVLNVHGTESVRELQRVAVEESRLGIPLLFGFDVIHGFKSLSPIPLAEAASWDLEAIRRSAEIAASEATAAGINWTFAPMVDITRDPRWGRVMEGAGEDPFLASRIAQARVQGFQGDDLSKSNTMAACAKHFAAYGFVEGGREYNTSDIGTHTLYNVVLPPFKAAVDAGVQSVMSGFQILNGIPVSASAFLQRTVLKDQWGFDGFIVSDWATIKEMEVHGYTPDGKTSSIQAISAGLDMDMESRLYINHLVELVEEGRIDESLINDAAARVLRVKFQLGLFDDPYKYCDTEREKKDIRNSSYDQDLLEIAEKSVVLLKNQANILPLDKHNLKIAVIGPLADDKTSPLGNWRLAAEEEQAISLWEGLSQYPADNGLQLAKGIKLVEKSPAFSQLAHVNVDDRTGLVRAVEIARSADLVILALGEHGMMSGEGRSRAHLDLPGLQNELLDAIHAVNENIILVLNTGRPLVLTEIESKAKAILLAWHLGDQHGNALARLIYGDANPSGKLPMTFPRDKGQIPIYYNHYNTGRPAQAHKDEVFWSHYNDLSREPLFPFGYGLSYTSFTYENLQIEQGRDDSPLLKLQVQVSNIGARVGREVVQLYVKSHYGEVVQPVRALKGFQSIYLAPGETKEVAFELTSKDLGYYTPQGNWIENSGLLTFYVGTNSNAKLSKDIRLDDSNP